MWTWWTKRKSEPRVNAINDRVLWPRDIVYILIIRSTSTPQASIDRFMGLSWAAQHSKQESLCRSRCHHGRGGRRTNGKLTLLSLLASGPVALLSSDSDGEGGEDSDNDNDEELGNEDGLDYI